MAVDNTEWVEKEKLTYFVLIHTSGKKLLVWTDNTTSQSAVSRRKSKDGNVNEEWKIIQRLLTELACNIEAKRVTLKGNVADAMSRGYLGELEWYAEVKIDVPSDLDRLIKQVFPPKIVKPAEI